MFCPNIGEENPLHIKKEPLIPKKYPPYVIEVRTHFLFQTKIPFLKMGMTMVLKGSPI